MQIRKKIMRALTEKNISQHELARSIGMHHSSLSRIILGKVQPTLPTLQKISKALGKSLEYFDEDFDPSQIREEQIPYGLRQLPLLGSIPAGKKRPTESYILKWIDIPRTFVGDYKEMFLVKADGDSMEGRGIFDGDLVAVAYGKRPHNGSIVVALINGDAVIRCFRKLNDKIRLEPANPKYASEEYDSKNDVDIKGVVVWSGRKHA